MIKEVIVPLLSKVVDVHIAMLIYVHRIHGFLIATTLILRCFKCLNVFIDFLSKSSMRLDTICCYLNSIKYFHKAEK